MNLAASLASTASLGALCLSPSKPSPHGPGLRLYADHPHLLCSDPRLGNLLSGYGEVGVLSIAFVLEEDCAPFGDGFAVAAGVVLCVVRSDAHRIDPKRLLPPGLRSQTNLDFWVTFEGEQGAAFVEALEALGLGRGERFVKRCTLEDLVHIDAPSTLDTHTAPSDYPPDEPPEPPAVVAVEAGTMQRQAFDTSFDVQTFEAMFELDALLEDQHAPSPTAGAATASGVAAAVDDAARTIPENEKALGEENIDRGCSRALATDAHQTAKEETAANDEGSDEDYAATDKEIEEALEGFNVASATGAPLFDLSVGCGAAVPDNSPEALSRRRPHSTFAPKLKPDGSEIVRGLARVRPLKLTFKQFGDLLRSHIKRKYRWKPGPFVVGATFGVSDKQPTGHRDGAHLICVSMLMLDIDDAPDFPTAYLEERLQSLAVAGIGYTTWSHGRRDVPKPKTGTCARVILPLAHPLTAPADLPWRERVALIGRQVAALVGFIGERLGIPLNSTALDKVSKQPEQLMYTPRMPAPGVKAWFFYQDGPALDPDNLPGGVTLAALLSTQPEQQATIPCALTSPPSDTPRAEPAASQPTHAQQLTHTTTSPTATTSPALPTTQHRKKPLPVPQFSGPPANDQEKSHRRLQRRAASSGYDLGPSVVANGTIKYSSAPACPCKRECPDGFAFFVNHDGPISFVCHHNTCPAGGKWPGAKACLEPIKLQDSTPSQESAAPSPASNAQPGAAQPHTEGASSAPRRSPPFAKGNPALGTCLALRRRFDLFRQDPPEQRPHLVCVDSVEDIDAIAAKIPDGKRVIVGIPKQHSLYPHAINTFLAKGCDVRRA